MELKEFKKQIDTEINKILKSKINSLPQTSNNNIKDNFTQLEKILSDGKRIRAYIAYISYISNGGKQNENAIKLFTFIEIFHAFCLVHDDIMDQAEKRHETQTIHKFSENLVKNNKFVSPAKYGESVAILLGDFLFAWSYENLNLNKDFENESLNRVREVFSDMINEVFMGQLIDINIPTLDKVSDEQIYLKIKLKTAGYSFTKPLIIGALLASEKINRDFYEKIGLHLGIAFQIQDDLMDLKYDESITSKSAFNDIYQHQHTLFTNYILKNGTTNQKEILNSSFGKKIKFEEQKELRKIFIDSGAFEYGEKLINDNLDDAKILLGQSDISIESKIFFENLIKLLQVRKK